MTVQVDKSLLLSPVRQLYFKVVYDFCVLTFAFFTVKGVTRGQARRFHSAMQLPVHLRTGKPGEIAVVMNEDVPFYRIHRQSLVQKFPNYINNDLSKSLLFH